VRLLLDTNVFLRFATGDARLTTRFTNAIQDSRNQVLLSSAAAWEICVKYQLGKLSLPESPDTYIPKTRLLHRISSLDFDEPSALRLLGLPLLHRDPFDRIMICQALEHELTIVTLDAEMQRYTAKFLS
jgi:PIN domain nuclease of toxin-antitoxin system